MNARFCLAACVLAMLLAADATTRGDDASQNPSKLVVSAAQKDHLNKEPILVTVRVGSQVAGLPAGLDKGPLQFQITPAVKPRKNAKPLPLEDKIESASTRRYDLLEWYEFPAEGTFQIQAVVKDDSAQVTSDAVTITIRNPDKQDAEWGPVDRLHHLPWSNYATEKFCGDTFDAAKQWPNSQLAQHCHYYSGLFSQHKEEYDEAIASFQVVAEKYPDSVLADAANYGIAECLMAQGKLAEAMAHIAKLQQVIRERPGNDSGSTCSALLDRLAGEIRKQQAAGGSGE